MGPGEDARLNQALERMWTQYLPVIEERVATLETASSNLLAGTHDGEQIAAANAAAHKLAGILGTFGLNDGTDLAREAEALCSTETEIDAAAAARLDAIARQIRAIIAARPSSMKQANLH